MTTPTSQSILSTLPPEMRHSLCQASELDRRLRGQLHTEPLPTAVPEIDHALGGGLPRGTLVELVGRRSCGRLATVLATLKATTDTGEVAALVDLGNHLDPQAAAEIGVCLERLLWLRPQRLPDALAAAETLISTGFSLVAVDLGLPPVPGRAPLAAWLRLARSATAHHAVALVSSPYRISGCTAAVVVGAGRSRGSWSGAVAMPRLLHGLVARLDVTGKHGPRAGDTIEAVFTVPEAVTVPAADTLRQTTHNSTELEVNHAEAL